MGPQGKHDYEIMGWYRVLDTDDLVDLADVQHSVKRRLEQEAENVLLTRVGGYRIATRNQRKSILRPEEQRIAELKSDLVVVVVVVQM